MCWEEKRKHKEATVGLTFPRSLGKVLTLRRLLWKKMHKKSEQVNKGVLHPQEQKEIREYRALYEEDARASEWSTGRKVECGAVKGARDRRAGDRCSKRWWVALTFGDVGR